jgi:hypothetical protein
MRSAAVAPRIVAGMINGDGTIARQTPPGAFTVVRQSAGVYAVTFVPPFGSPPIVVATNGQSSSAVLVNVEQTVTAGYARFITTTTAFAVIDAQFYFEALAPAR